jgi:hypothetical protein
MVEKETVLDLAIKIKKFNKQHYQGCPFYLERECECPFGLSQKLIEILSVEVVERIQTAFYFSFLTALVKAPTLAKTLVNVFKTRFPSS